VEKQNKEQSEVIMFSNFSKRFPFKNLPIIGLILALMVLPAGCFRHHRHRDRNVRPTRASLIIQKTAPYQNWAAVRNQMKRDCDIEAQVPAMVKKFAKGYDNVFLNDIIPADTVAAVLTMTIKDARGMTGGVYSGAKSITVEGTLKQDGHVLGTFVDRSESAVGRVKLRGIMNPKGQLMVGTCQLLFQSAESIGEDVAEWLQKPTMNAQLGEAGKPQEDEGKSTDTEAKDPANK
jgi:hypothetical protein